MIVYSDGSWECGADEEKISDGATIIDDNSSTAQQIRQHTRVSITDGIVKAISDRKDEIAAELDSHRSQRLLCAELAANGDPQPLRRLLVQSGEQAPH